MPESPINYKINIQLASNAKELIAEISSAAKQAASGLSGGAHFGGELQAATGRAQQLTQSGMMSPADLQKVLRYSVTSSAAVVEERGPGFGREMRKKGGYDPTAIDADKEYASAQVQAAANKRKQAIASQQEISATTEYVEDQVTLAKMFRSEAAQVQNLLATDADYIADTAIVAIGRQKEAALVQDLLATDADYVADTAIAAIAKAKEAAAVQDLVSTDAEYIAATVQAAAGRQKEAAAVQAALAVDADYIADTAIVAISRQKQAAEVGELTSTDDQYIQSTARVAANRAREDAATQELLAVDADYIVDTARAAIARQKQAAEVEELTATDGEYIASTVRIATSRARQEAVIQEELAVDSDYIVDTARAAIGRQKQAAEIAELTATDDQYVAATVRITAAHQAEAAVVQEKLAVDSDYIVDTARAAIARQQEAADVAELTATDDQYVAATAKSAAARQLEAASVQEILAVDADYIVDTARTAIARQQQAAEVAELVGTDTQYIAATARTTAARQAEAAAVQELLAVDADYLVDTARTAIARQQQAAEVAQLTSTDAQYIAATVKIASSRERQAADVQIGLNNDAAYRESTLRLAIARQRQQADLQQALAGEEAYRIATVDATRARETIKAKVAEALATDTAYNAATVRATIAREQQKADIQARLAADPAYAAATVAATSAREQQQAKIKQGLATDQAYIEATAQIALAREEQAARVKLAQAGETSGLLLRPRAGGAPGEAESLTQNERTALLARAALVDRQRADAQAAATARMAAREDEASIRARVERRIAETQETAMIRKEEREIMRGMIKRGEAGGTWYQRVTALASPQAVAPTEKPTGPQAIVQKTVTSAGYAVGGMLSAAALFGTIEAVKEASKLQEIFAGLKGQMDSIGQAGAFGEVRDGIKQISDETGIAASQVAKFAARLLGVFNDPARALQETDAAMKLAVISGTDLATMIEELVPIAQMFGVSIEHIGDVAVGIHDKFGIAEESILHFLGEVAPMADEAGLSMEAMGVIGATAANSMGKSLTVAGEQFNKVLPTMQANQDKIYQILSARPETAKFVDPMIEAFGRGESGAALKSLLQAYNGLDRVQQQNLIRVSGSRREWAFLNGIFANSTKLLDDIAEAEGGAGRNAGGLERRFGEVSATLSRNMERIQQAFKNAIETFLSSGLGDALSVIGEGIESILKLVNWLTSAFTKLNAITGDFIPGLKDTGLLMPFVQMTAAVWAASKAFSFLNSVRASGAEGSIRLAAGERLVSVEVGRRAQVTAEAEGTTASDTATKEADATATGELAASEEALAGARGAAATGATTEAGATGTDVAAKQADAVATGEDVVAEDALVASRSAGTLAAEGETTATSTTTVATEAGAVAAGEAALAEDALATSRAANTVAAESEAVATGGANVANAAGGAGRLATMFPTVAGWLGKGGGAAAGAGAAGAGVAGEGAAAAGGAGLASIALPVAIGGFMVKQARDRESDKLNKQADDLREGMKKATEERLREVAGQYHGMMDEFQSKIFNVDLPGDLAAQELARRKGARGVTAISVLQQRGWLDRFAQEISQARIDELNAYMNQSDENKAYAIQQLDAAVEQSFASKIAGVGRNLYKFRTGQDLPTGIGYGDVKITKENMKEWLPKLKEAAERKDEKANELVPIIEEAIKESRSMADIRKAVDDAVAAGNVGKAIEEAGGLNEFLAIQGLYAPEEQLQAGKIGRGQYLTQIKDTIARLQKQLSSAPDPEKAQKELSAQQVKAQQISDQIVKESIDQYKRVAAITQERPKGAILGTELMKLPKLTMPEQINMIPTLIQDRWDAFQEQLSHIQDPEQRYQAAMQGVEIDKPTKILQLVKNLKDSPVGAFADRLKTDQQSQDDFFTEVAKIRVEQGKSLRDVIYDYAAKRYANKEDKSDWTKILNDLGKITDQEWHDLDQYISHLTSPKEMLDRMRAESAAKTATAAADAKAIAGGTSPMAAAQGELDKANIELQKLLTLQEAGSTDPDLAANIQAARNNVAKAQQQVTSVLHQTAAAMDQWAVVYAAGDPVKEANAELAASVNQANRILEENAGDKTDPKYISELQNQERIRQKQRDNRNAITKARMELAAFDTSEDPQEAAKHAREMAQFDLRNAKGEEERLRALLAIKEADRQARDADRERAKAARELIAFDRNQDPVAAAQDAINEANIAIAEARGKGGGAEDAAALQLKQARRQMAEAIEASVEADAQLAITMATIRQDPVGAARLTVDDALRKLNAARAAGKGNAEIKQLMGELAQAQSNALDTAVSEQVELTDFMLEMGQITTAQAIQRLTVERDKYDVGTKKWRDLQLKIHSLEQGAKADNQFNLPANIALPTLYEARRLNQSRAMGVGYMDNRNIALTFNVDGAQDPAAVSSQIMNALQGAMGGGQIYTPGVSVGAFN